MEFYLFKAACFFSCIVFVASVSRSLGGVLQIPDVHDNARYECLHNAHLGLEGLPALYDVAKNLADCCVPQEYGITARFVVVVMVGVGVGAVVVVLVICCWCVYGFRP